MIYLPFIMESIIIQDSPMILASSMPLFFNREISLNSYNASTLLLDLQTSFTAYVFLVCPLGSQRIPPAPTALASMSPF